MMEIRLKSAYLEPLFVCLCLLTVLGPANGATVVRVTDGSEAVLPCFIRPERDITQDVFEWKKDGQKVFFYERGLHSNNGHEGQDEQFKGQVSHFQDQLQFSNASIVISDTKRSDSGTYTCDFSPDEPNRQTFTIKLVVVPCPKPQLTTSKQTKDWLQLQCEVRGVSPNHKVEVKDSDENILSAEEANVTDSEGSYNIILNTTVTKTDNYSCVVTQEEICHQVSDKISVNVPVAATEPYIRILEETKNSALLQCVVRGASPKPKVKWQDSSGNILPAEEPQVTERGGSYDIIHNTTVTKTDKYRCVVTQEEINHQTEAETDVHISGSPTGLVVGAVLGTLFVVVIVVGVVLAVLYKKRYISITYQRVPQTETERDEEKNPTESVELNKKPDTSSQTETEKDEEKKPTESDKLNKKPDTSEPQ